MEQSKWIITKRFEFEYGHRVHSQLLRPSLALTSNCACRRLHGHHGEITVELAANELTRGMVIDFVELNFFKQFIDNCLDHKSIIDISDPGLRWLIMGYRTVMEDGWDWHKASWMKGPGVPFRWYGDEGYWVANPEFWQHRLDPDLEMPDSEAMALQEILTSYIFVDFVPTSENLSAWFYQIIHKRLAPFGVQVSGVKFCETPKTSSLYLPPGQGQI